jgi:iron complex transport system ATP-binding protein
MSAPLLSARQLSVRIGALRVVADLDLTVAAGERLAILGRNGAGKTTLLHTLAGLRPPSAGRIELEGTPMEALDGRQTAQLRGLLAQQQQDAFPSTVLETALVGRHPHLTRWDWEGARDERIAREALAAVGLEGINDRDIRTLSGGERQRLAIATLLAQQPRLALLDEPLAHLDLNHQVAVLELFARQAAVGGMGIVMVLHDVNLARRYADRALLLFGDGRSEAGPVERILTAEMLSALYGHPLREIRDGSGGHFVPV